MIEPQETDIGRMVIYVGGFDEEEGIITSFNDKYVFVRYGSEKDSKATRREDLIWANTAEGSNRK